MCRLALGARFDSSIVDSPGHEPTPQHRRQIKSSTQHVCHHGKKREAVHRIAPRPRSPPFQRHEARSCFSPEDQKIYSKTSKSCSIKLISPQPTSRRTLGLRPRHLSKLHVRGAWQAKTTPGTKPSTILDTAHLDPFNQTAEALDLDMCFLLHLCQSAFP